MVTAFERALHLAEHVLLSRRPLTAEDIRMRYGVSRAQSQRDLLMIETILRVDATTGFRGQRLLTPPKKD